MIKNSMGYIFECRKDVNGDSGVIESFKTLIKDSERHVNIVMAVDKSGRIIIPAVSITSLGFTPMNKIYVSEEEIEVFAKSRKPIFGKIGEFTLICAGTIVLNNETGEVVSTSKLGLYVPKTIMTNIPEMTNANGEVMPALVCEKLGSSRGIDEFGVNSYIYNSYISNLVKDFTLESTKSRESFIKKIVLERS